MELSATNLELLRLLESLCLGREGFCGLTQLGARPYDPTLGRFIAPDPEFNSADPQNFNGYAYAHNNPATASDPTGLADNLHPVYIGSDFWSRSGRGWKTYYRADYYIFCTSGGGCLGGYDSDNNPWLLVAVDIYAFTVRIPIFYGPVVAPRPIAPVRPCVARPDPPKAPAAEPTCGFFDVKCGMNHPGRWWKGNKNWVYAGAAVAACATGVGCFATAALTAGLSMADRTYSFAHNREYDGGVAAYGAFALGLGLDALGVVPGGGAAAKGLVTAKGLGAAERRIGAEAAETAAKACSFSGATLVLMADGSRKPIEDVKVGDEVLATDPETGEEAAKKVEHVFVHDDDLTDLELADGSVLTTTEDHPYWSVDDQRFERADELSRGERVLGAGGGTIQVSGLRLATTRDGLAYNLSVEGIHTYHVGDDAILVHNTCGPNVSTRPGQIADQLGYSTREIKDAIHAVKRDGMPRGGAQRNPDVVVDLDTGEVHVKLPDGNPSSDSIGNIFDHLRER